MIIENNDSNLPKRDETRFAENDERNKPKFLKYSGLILFIVIFALIKYGMSGSFSSNPERLSNVLNIIPFVILAGYIILKLIPLFMKYVVHRVK